MKLTSGYLLFDCTMKTYFEICMDGSLYRYYLISTILIDDSLLLRKKTRPIRIFLTNYVWIFQHCIKTATELAKLFYSNVTRLEKPLGR